MRLRTNTGPLWLRPMNTRLALGLPAVAPSRSKVINARCTLRAEADQRVILGGGLGVHHSCAADAVAEAYAMLMWVDAGFAQQVQVARALGLCERTVRRQQDRYAVAGMVGLGRPQGWRHGGADFRQAVTTQRESQKPGVEQPGSRAAAGCSRERHEHVGGDLPGERAARVTAIGCD